MSVTNNSSCPWCSIPEHVSNDGCILIESDMNSVQHVFNNTSYTMSSKTGLPMYNETEFSGGVELSNYKFSRNNPRCTVISTKFNINDFIHVSNFTVNSAYQFWWFLDSVVKLWMRFIDKHEMYPRDKTMMDFLVPRAADQSSVIFLKPIHYTDNVNHFNFGISSLLYNLYKNSYANFNMPVERSKPPKLYCGRDCKFSQMYDTDIKWWLPLRCLFGKNMYIHSICCTDRNKMNIDWREFTRSLIERRRSECEGNTTKASNKNQINYLHKKWLISINKKE